MPYRSPFVDIAYPDENGEAWASQSRIAFTDGPSRLAVVHVLHTEPSFTSPATSSIVRDQLLNRILDHALRVLRVNAIRLVVEDGSAIAEYAIEVDMDDYIARGNPYEAGQVAASGARLRESISI